jgi:putative Holliday junction resolvase
VRVLAVDPGDARIGIAISDPLGLIARPLLVIEHTNRSQDALRIIELANEHKAQTIVIGIALNQDGEVSHQARKVLRLVSEIRLSTDLHVLTWDESGSTEEALAIGADDEMLDARAAAVILQDYLNVQAT